MKELKLDTINGFFSFYTEFPYNITGAPGKARILVRSLDKHIEVEGVVLVGNPEELPKDFSAYFEKDGRRPELNHRLQLDNFERQVKSIYNSIFPDYVKDKSWSFSSNLLGHYSRNGDEVVKDFLKYGNAQGIVIDNPGSHCFNGLGCTPVPFRGRLEELTYDNQRVDVIPYQDPSYRVKIGMFSKEDAEKLKVFELAEVQKKNANR